MQESEVDLNGMRVLLAVVHAGGFSAAARQLGVPTNRLSRQVQRLEQALGVRLLQRTTRKLSLTTAGRHFVERAEPAMQVLAQCWEETSAKSEQPRGHLRITAPIDFMNVASSLFLSKFLEQYPALSLELILSDDQLDMFASGIDAAFRAGPIHDENVIARRLIASNLLLVASPALLEQRGIPDSIEALSDYPCLALKSKDGWATWALNGPDGVQQVNVQARLTVNGMGALVNAAKGGLGIALVPDHLVAQDLANGSLQQVLTDYYHNGGGIYLAYSSHKHPPAALRAFINFVFDEVESANATS